MSKINYQKILPAPTEDGYKTDSALEGSRYDMPAPLLEWVKIKDVSIPDYNQPPPELTKKGVIHQRTHWEKCSQ